jgi:hypothetical protein
MPSLFTVLLVAFGESLWGGALPRLSPQRNDAWGITVPVPDSWKPGANRLGQLAWYNGLPSLGRATFSAGAAHMPEGADVQRQAGRFIEEALDPRALGTEVLKVTHEPPATARIADRDAVKVRARFEEPQSETAVGVMLSPAVRQIVAVDRSQNHISKSHDRRCVRRVLDFPGIEPATRITGIDRAELAGAGADGAHEHQRGGAVIPALADVRAHRFFADRREALLANEAPESLEGLACRDTRLEPGRLRECRGLLPADAELDAVLDGRMALFRTVLGTGADDRYAAKLAQAHCTQGHVGGEIIARSGGTKKSPVLGPGESQGKP